MVLQHPNITFSLIACQYPLQVRAFIGSDIIDSHIFCSFISVRMHKNGVRELFSYLFNGIHIPEGSSKYNLISLLCESPKCTFRVGII